jgi:hypothetical protein
MGAMIIRRTVIDRVVVAVEIPAVDVVDVAVAVVVDAIDQIAGVRPDLADQFRVGEHDAFINLAHEDARRTGVARQPCFARQATVLIGGRGGVAVPAPQRSVGVVRVVRDCFVVVVEVRLGELDPGARVQRTDRGGHGHRRTHDREALDVAAVLHGPGQDAGADNAPHHAQRRAAIGGRDAGRELHDHFAGDIVETRPIGADVFKGRRLLHGRRLGRPGFPFASHQRHHRENQKRSAHDNVATPSPSEHGQAPF